MSEERDVGPGPEVCRRSWNEGGIVMDKVGKHQEKSRFGGKEK